MNLAQIVVLAIIQGMAELLPVSSSAHVIFAQHLMGLDPSAPEMTFLLVMLHTGTMFAVLAFFFSRWRNLFKDRATARPFIRGLILATLATGVLGLGLKVLIEKIILEHLMGYQKGEVEALFKFLPLMGIALAMAGALIIVAAFRKPGPPNRNLNDKNSIIIGIIQGLCLPLRGFSRSGATISTAMILDIPFHTAEDFSFALAIILTPPVILLELKRLLAAHSNTATHFSTLLAPGLIGMVMSFCAGLVALKWLSAWLEGGHWRRFGYYCLAFACVILATSFL